MTINRSLSPLPARVVPLPQRSVAAASIGSSYSLVGTIFSQGVVLLYVMSNLDQAVQISFDGVKDFMPIFANAAVSFDFRADNASLPGVYGVYVKQIGVPTSGNLYVSAISI